MERRKIDAIDIAINCVKDVPSCDYKGERAKNDIISVLEEAKNYFSKQEKPKEMTIADHHPPGYVEPLCKECLIYKEIKEELVGDMIKACEKALQFIYNGIEFGYIRMPGADMSDPAHETPGMLAAAIAKAKGEEGK